MRRGVGEGDGPPGRNAIRVLNAPVVGAPVRRDDIPDRVVFRDEHAPDSRRQILLSMPFRTGLRSLHI